MESWWISGRWRPGGALGAQMDAACKGQSLQTPLRPYAKTSHRWTSDELGLLVLGRGVMFTDLRNPRSPLAFRSQKNVTSPFAVRNRRAKSERIACAPRALTTCSGVEEAVNRPQIFDLHLESGLAIMRRILSVSSTTNVSVMFLKW